MGAQTVMTHALIPGMGTGVESVPNQGVTLRKITDHLSLRVSDADLDRYARARYVRDMAPLGSAAMLDRNDLRALSVIFDVGVRLSR